MTPRAFLVLAALVTGCGPRLATPQVVEVPTPVRPTVPAEVLAPVVLGQPPAFTRPADPDAVACLTAGNVALLQDLLLALRGAALECRAVLREIAR